MDTFDYFIKTLEHSIRRYGPNKKVRLEYLYNLCKYAKRLEEQSEIEHGLQHQRQTTREDVDNFILLKQLDKYGKFTDIKFLNHGEKRIK